MCRNFEQYQNFTGLHCNLFFILYFITNNYYCNRSFLLKILLWAIFYLWCQRKEVRKGKVYGLIVGYVDIVFLLHGFDSDNSLVDNQCILWFNLQAMATLLFCWSPLDPRKTWRKSAYHLIFTGPCEWKGIFCFYLYLST